MENNETTFYLGEKKTGSEPVNNPYKNDPVISYGGEMPLVFSNEEYVPLTNDEIENKRILSEMLEKKNMISRRLLYLEGKKQDLLGYYMKIEKNDKGRYVREFVKVFLFFIGLFIVLTLGALNKKAAITAAVTMIVFSLVIYIRYRVEGTDEKLEDLDRKMNGMEEEHRKLEFEKEKLEEKIKEFKEHEKEQGHI